MVEIELYHLPLSSTPWDVSFLPGWRSGNRVVGLLVEQGSRFTSHKASLHLRDTHPPSGKKAKTLVLRAPTLGLIRIL